MDRIFIFNRMNLDARKQLLKQWGESTAYSAKSHFKSADGRRALTTRLLLITIATSVVCIVDDYLPKLVQRLVGCASLAASMWLLVWGQKGEADYVSESMRWGNEYLTLHNAIHKAYLDEATTDSDVAKLNDWMAKLNLATRPHISQRAKRQAKRAIEQLGEMTTWWRNA